MKRVTVLLTEKAIIGAIGNIHYMFGLVNEFLSQSEKFPLFEVSLVGTTREVKLDKGLFTIKADALLSEVKETDLIIIPPLSGDMAEAVSENEAYVQWTREQYERGAEVASLCLGAFLLAETGLLNGETCSTHWKGANEFRRRYPEVQMVDQHITTDHKGLYTSGGANSYWNLLVYLIQKYTSREIAIQASKFFEVEMDRSHQHQFLIFEGNKKHEDELIKRVQEYIELNYQEKLNITELAASVNLSNRTFQRRFKKATHYTLLEYIQKVRVEVAKKYLESETPNVNEAMYKAGYLDPKAFRDLFRKQTGLSPFEYKRRFRGLFEVM